ncbi:sugar phosphate isomerase/epimerase [Patescibacteria group bacterium]|nr:sugar phosphate isomerase/epimerase [Patescibacteria group bacterium]
MLAITTDSFAGYGLDHTFKLIKKADLDGVEVVIRHGEFDAQNADYLKELSERHRLPIVALSMQVEMNAKKAQRAVALAEQVGIPLITITPPGIFDFNYKKWLKETAPSLRRRKKVKIALVNPPAKMIFGIFPKYAYNNIYELKQFDDIAFDTSNIVGRTEPLLEIYSILKSKIHYVHLSNVNHEQTHTLLESGSVPLESFLTRLAREKFEGILALKFNSKALGLGNDEKVLENLESCKKFVAKYFREE